MKYGVFKLTKIKGEKEYIPNVICKGLSWKKAIDTLEDFYNEYFNDAHLSFGGGKCFYNKKIAAIETYCLDNDVLYLPNYSEEKLLGVWRDSPIYAVLEYPNFAKKFKIKKRNNTIVLENAE